MTALFTGWCSVEYELVADNYFIILAPCGCGGDPECGCANGTAVVDEVDLGPLLQGLAIAGALAETWRLAQINAIQWWRGSAVRHHGPWGYAP